MSVKDKPRKIFREPPELPNDGKSQGDKFREAARELETDDDEKRFDERLGKIAKAPAKICPECGHVFQGNGWDGIDAHWKAKHDKIMPYAEAWPSLSDGTYQKR